VARRITFAPPRARPLPSHVAGPGSVADKARTLLNDVAARCRADAAVLLVREGDGWRVLAVAGPAGRGMKVGDVYSTAQNPSLSPEFSEHRPGLPSRAEPFLAALGPVALGDWITCPVVGPPGQVGLMHLFTSWTRPFSNDDVERAAEAADLAAALLGAPPAQRAEATGGEGVDLARTVSLLSHDLRSPLNAILGFSEMLADGTCAPDQVVRYAEVIRRGGQSVLEMLDQIVAQLRIAMGVYPWQPAEAPVRAFLGDAGATGDLMAMAAWDTVLFPRACRALLDVVAVLGGERRLAVRVEDGHAVLTFGAAAGPNEADEADEPLEATFGGVPAQFARTAFTAHGAIARVGGHGARFTVRVPLRPAVFTAPADPKPRGAGGA
jgi:His Kinase A (phospho-acceptor) domain